MAGYLQVEPHLSESSSSKCGQRQQIQKAIEASSRKLEFIAKGSKFDSVPEMSEEHAPSSAMLAKFQSLFGQDKQEGEPNSELEIQLDHPSEEERKAADR